MHRMLFDRELTGRSNAKVTDKFVFDRIDACHVEEDKTGKIDMAINFTRI